MKIFWSDLTMTFLTSVLFGFSLILYETIEHSIRSLGRKVYVTFAFGSRSKKFKNHWSNVCCMQSSAGCRKCRNTPCLFFPAKINALSRAQSGNRHIHLLCNTRDFPPTVFLENCSIADHHSCRCLQADGNCLYVRLPEIKHWKER